MRLALAVVLLVGCVPTESDDFSDDSWSDDDSSDWTGTDGVPIEGCAHDTDCTGSDVCARDGQCYAPSHVRAVHVSWTLRGQPASVQSCRAEPNLDISFESVDWAFGYAPVPCANGRYTIDKLPDAYTSVWLGTDATAGAASVIPASNEAVIDLPY